MFLYRPFHSFFVFLDYFLSQKFSLTHTKPYGERLRPTQEIQSLGLSYASYMFFTYFQPSQTCLNHLFVFISFVLVHFSCFYCIFCSFYCLSFFLYRLREIFSITFFELLRPILRFRGRWLMYPRSHCLGFDVQQRFPRFDTWFLTWPCLPFGFLSQIIASGTEVKI